MTERAAPGDHFSGVAAGYAEFRPRYPSALFEQIAPLAPGRRLAWDCAAGTGQATLDLAEWFDHVVATDVSASQIAQAPGHPKITWRVAPAEASGIPAGTVDLVTVAQALHWFDRAAFFAEARRVAVDRGVIAVWTYGSPESAGDLGAALGNYEHVTVADFWPVERRSVDEAYATISFPFEPLPFPAMRMTEEWTRQQLLGYLRTWSATTRYIAAQGVDPVDEFAARLPAVWPDADARRIITWPLTVRVGRMSNR